MEKRKFATYEIEDGLLHEGCNVVVGVDEVGRGPGAGPVTAGAVWIPSISLPLLMAKVKDSKALSEKRRDVLYKLIDRTCVWSVQSVDNNTIDKINILQATKLAMRKALYYLDVSKIDHVLVDGTVKLDGAFTDTPQTQVIRGDSKSISIAAASIMAKVVRDEEMRTMHWIHPQYGWIRNKGYLTKEHIEAIQTYGITDYHRKSFRKVGS